MVINLAHNTDNSDLFPPGQEEEDREQGWWRPSDSDLSEGLSFCLFTFHMSKMSVGCLDSAQPGPAGLRMAWIRRGSRHQARATAECCNLEEMGYPQIYQTALKISSSTWNHNSHYGGASWPPDNSHGPAAPKSLLLCPETAHATWSQQHIHRLGGWVGATASMGRLRCPALGTVQGQGPWGHQPFPWRLRSRRYIQYSSLPSLQPSHPPRHFDRANHTLPRETHRREG